MLLNNASHPQYPGSLRTTKELDRTEAAAGEGFRKTVLPPVLTKEIRFSDMNK